MPVEGVFSVSAKRTRQLDHGLCAQGGTCMRGRGLRLDTTGYRAERVRAGGSNRGCRGDLWPGVRRVCEGARARPGWARGTFRARGKIWLAFSLKANLKGAGAVAIGGAARLRDADHSIAASPDYASKTTLTNNLPSARSPRMGAKVQSLTFSTIIHAFWCSRWAARVSSKIHRTTGFRRGASGLVATDCERAAAAEAQPQLRQPQFSQQTPNVSAVPTHFALAALTTRT